MGGAAAGAAGGARYVQWRPGAAPGRQVRCLWVRENAGGPAYRQLVVPDGCVDLVWSGGALEVVGPDRAPRSVPVSGGAGLAGVRFRPGAAGLLLGAVPARELCDLQVPLGEVLGPEAAERLGERLGRARDTRAAASLLDAFAASLARRWTPDAAVERAVAELGRADAARVPVIAEELGLSERQLRRRITDAVGYGPKTLQGVLRFRRAVDEARSGGLGLAEAAVRAGYADQAHFTREVRRWSGVSPTVLLGRPGRAERPG